MATHVQQYRGTTAQHVNYTGPIGELTVDTTKMTAVVQDGVTAGGHPLAKESTPVTGDTYVKVNAGANGTLASALALSLDIDGLASGLVSTDADNGLSLGSDNKLFAKAPEAALIIRQGDNILHDDGNGKIAADIDFAYNTTTGKFDLIGHDGVTVIASVTVPSSVSMLVNAELVADDPSQPGVEGPFFKLTMRLADNTTKDLYVNANSLEDVYTGQDGVVVEGTVIRAVPSQMVSIDANNAVKLGVDDRFHVKVVSADANNLVTTGSDAGAVVTKDGITDAVKDIVLESLDDPAESLACAMISPSPGNQIVCDNGRLFLSMDYGTM